MAKVRQGKIEKEIILGFAILGAFLIFHRVISDKMLEEADKNSATEIEIKEILSKTFNKA